MGGRHQEYSAQCETSSVCPGQQGNLHILGCIVDKKPMEGAHIWHLTGRAPRGNIFCELLQYIFGPRKWESFLTHDMHFVYGFSAVHMDNVRLDDSRVRLRQPSTAAPKWKWHRRFGLDTRRGGNLRQNKMSLSVISYLPFHSCENLKVYSGPFPCQVSDGIFSVYFIHIIYQNKVRNRFAYIHL